jgi:hypothetical protein
MMQEFKALLAFLVLQGVIRGYEEHTEEAQ